MVGALRKLAVNKGLKAMLNKLLKKLEIEKRARHNQDKDQDVEDIILAEDLKTILESAETISCLLYISADNPNLNP
ncbi:MULTISPECIES: hypothetical protein [unclassified Paracoccus (in: a-proteobacteria)]|uniref:hypothetical protein n=1 Tax=unclassified Paracoccus (in: a-proteobacteria) TaxID=2688777 RepID=UPI001FFDFC04|nr:MULTISPECIES: hypothetical protein [unclassified Paracoccus (in: a-proteobacteria)]